MEIWGSAYIERCKDYFCEGSEKLRCCCTKINLLLQVTGIIIGLMVQIDTLFTLGLFLLAASTLTCSFSVRPDASVKNAPTRGFTTEAERRIGWEERGYAWPPRYVPHDRPGWKNLFERRFRQLQGIEIGDSEDMYTRKYNGWVSAVTSALVVPTFTDKGWKIVRVDDEVVEGLKTELREVRSDEE